MAIKDELPPDPQTDPDWMIHAVGYYRRQLDEARSERDDFYRWTVKVASALSVSIDDLPGSEPPCDVVAGYAELRQRILKAIS